MGPCVVGIDSGTQGVRVIVFDLAGETVSAGEARHNPMAIPEPAGAEQDPHDLWDRLCRASVEAMAPLGGRGVELAAVSLAAQRSVVVAVDAAGRPLRPAFSWLDRRQAEAVAALPGCSTGQREQQIRSKANWMKVNEPRLYEQTACFLSASGWLTYQLCGQFKDSVGGLGAAFPMDIGRLGWSEDTRLHALLGMPPERLPEIFQPGMLLGRISREAAQQTGLPEGLPLVAGAGDKSCEMLGAGAISHRQGYISYGSLANLEVLARTPIEASRGEYWTTPGAVQGTWNLEFGMECGYLMVRWFCEQFGGADVGGSGPATGTLEQALGEQAAMIAPGADGLLLAPYWSRLGIVPGAQSVLLGLEKRHTRAHLFRAILEGIAFGLREGQEVLSRDTGVALDEIFIGGGGAQSDLAVQITADILGLPIVKMQTAQTCALGAAIEAAVGAGLYGSYREAVDQMCRRSRVFRPDAARQKFYDAVYTRLYQKLYPALSEVFAEFKAIFCDIGAGG
jgi:sugar (pentulose or hexulose) kinase